MDNVCGEPMTLVTVPCLLPWNVSQSRHDVQKGRPILDYDHMTCQESRACALKYFLTEWYENDTNFHYALQFTGNCALCITFPSRTSPTLGTHRFQIQEDFSQSKTGFVHSKIVFKEAQNNQQFSPVSPSFFPPPPTLMQFSKKCSKNGPSHDCLLDTTRIDVARSDTTAYHGAFRISTTLCVGTTSIASKGAVLKYCDEWTCSAVSHEMHLLFFSFCPRTSFKSFTCFSVNVNSLHPIPLPISQSTDRLGSEQGTDGCL